MASTTNPNSNLISKFLGIVEKVGNLLPHPATLFVIFAALTVVLSWVFSLTDISVVKPGTDDIIRPFNLLSVEGVQMMLMGLVKNFTGFAPLGTVLVALLGIGIAESSGLIASTIRLIVQNAYKVLIGMMTGLATIAIGTMLFFNPVFLHIAGVALFTGLSVFAIWYINKNHPDYILTFIIVFSGILSNMASEIGYVLLVPLGAIMFIGAGRHPIAGFAAAFAGVSGGYSANLMIGTIDPLLAGLSEEAAHIIDPSYTVNSLANYFFMFVSTFFIAIAGTWVTQRFVEPRLGKYEGDEALSDDDKDKIKALTPEEKKGVLYALIAGAVFIGTILYGAIPSDGFLRDANLQMGDMDWVTYQLKSLKPLLKSVVAFIFIAGAAMGIGYGIGAKTIKSDSDVMNGMGKTMETLGIYIVLVFFAAQFVAYFKWTNLGIIFAITGAEVLQASGLGPIPLMIAFIILSAIINLVMGSASAKWAIMAPVFIPMFMLIGYSPELIQGAYRVGDSVTNIISPMMSYFALIVAFMERYVRKAGIGTVIATMLPYTIMFFIVWTILFIIWFQLGIPLGPDSPMFIDIPGQ
jgi:aminobenzoyl-glutamate transport protein